MLGDQLAGAVLAMTIRVGFLLADNLLNPPYRYVHARTIGFRVSRAAMRTYYTVLPRNSPGTWTGQKGNAFHERYSDHRAKRSWTGRFHLRRRRYTCTSRMLASGKISRSARRLRRCRAKAALTALRRVREAGELGEGSWQLGQSVTGSQS